MTDVVGISTRLVRRKQAQQVGWQVDQRIVGKAHIERFEAHAENLAALVQPRGATPRFRVFHNLLDPAEQGNVGTVDVAPSAMSRLRCWDGHGPPARRQLIAASRALIGCRYRAEREAMWVTSETRHAGLADCRRSDDRNQPPRIVRPGRAARVMTVVRPVCRCHVTSRTSTLPSIIKALSLRSRGTREGDSGVLVLCYLQLTSITRSSTLFSWVTTPGERAKRQR